MTALIAAGVIGDTSAGHTKAELAVELEDLRDFIAESVLGAAARHELTIASGAVTPPDGASAGGAIYKIDTEGGASSDILDTLTQTNTHDGQLLVLMAENTARVVTLNHAAGGTGQMLMTDSLDFVLDTASKWIMFRRDGADWVEFMRYGGADFVGDTAGQCRLDWTSTTVLTLSREGGSKLFIDGAWRTIPSSGPTLSTATALIETGSLAINTVYYVYAYMSGTTMTLGASATAPATDANYGHKIRSGDAAKTLVGMCRTNGSTQFYDVIAGASPGQNIGVLSYFNRRRKAARSVSGSNYSTASAPWLQVNSGLQLLFLSWGDTAARMVTDGTCLQSGAAQLCYLGIGYDSTSAVSAQGYCMATSAFAGVAHAETTFKPTEGHHYVTPLHGTGGGTVTWTSGYVATVVEVEG